MDGIDTISNVTVRMRRAAFLIAASVLILNAASSLTTVQDPDLAVKLNPLNTDARLRRITTAMANANLTDRELSQLKRDARTLIHLSPSLARGHTRLGEIYLRAGNTALAQGQFLKALSIDPSEIDALRHRLRRTVETGAWEEAAERVDVYLRRRWRFPEIKPVIRALAEDPTGTAHLRARLTPAPPWRGYALGVIAGTAEGADWIRKLREEEATAAEP